MLLWRRNCEEIFLVVSVGKKEYSCSANCPFAQVPHIKQAIHWIWSLAGKWILNLEARTEVPWSDYYALKVQLDISTPPHQDEKQISVRPWNPVGPVSFQNALQEPVLSSNSLDELRED